jgi:hypothetical protein
LRGWLWNYSTSDFFYGIKTGRANFPAGAASSTLFLINVVNKVLSTINCTYRAISQANQAGLALLRINVI